MVDCELCGASCNGNLECTECLCVICPLCVGNEENRLCTDCASEMKKPEDSNFFGGFFDDGTDVDDDENSVGIGPEW